ncbi:MAG: TIGR03545 family protein [Endomicrobium sp.]|nr:TIGR03545 family protein [Endomicrobium sp.]
MKIFRFSFLLPALIIISAVFVFTLHFLDGYIKKSLISAGELAFGAKVEIGGVKTSFKNLGVSVSGLKIGDKDDEYKNLADIDNINFKVRFLPLLSKKVIIDDMSVDGVKWGTKRIFSAKLPLKQEKKVKKNDASSFAQKEIDNIKDSSNKEFDSFPSVQKFNEIQKQIKDFSPQTVIDMAGIKSVESVQNYYVGLMGKYDFYLKKVNDIDLNLHYKEISQLSDAISKVSLKSAEDVKKLSELLKRIKKEKEKLEQTYSYLKSVKNSLAAESKSVKTAFKDVNALVAQDVDNIASKLSIPSFDLKGISKMLFGGVWVSRAEKVLYYLNLARKYIPQSSSKDDKSAAAKDDIPQSYQTGGKSEAVPQASTQKDKPEVKERQKGRDISYPLKSVLPKLLISNISISGTSGVEGKDGEIIKFKGSIKNITSNQKLIGKPISFEISGDDSNQTFNLSGSFDRLADTAADKLVFVMDGYDAARLGVPSTDYTPSLRNAKMHFEADFTLFASDFFSNASIKITSVSYNAQDKNFGNIDKTMQKHLSALWKGINSIDIKTSISVMEKDSAVFSFSSDIDKIMSAKFASIISSAVGDVKIKIDEEVRHYVETQKKVLQGEADKYSDGLQKEIDAKLSDLTKQNNALKDLIAKKEKELKLPITSSLANLLQPK